VTDRSNASDPVREDIVEIPIEKWDAIVAELERFAGERGEVLETDEGVAYEVGNARFEIQRSGVVSAGMPLHDLDGMEAAVLRFDHANGALTVLAGTEGGDAKEGDDEGTERFEYTFRRP
jgi:hypothetical protein